MSQSNRLKQLMFAAGLSLGVVAGVGSTPAAGQAALDTLLFDRDNSRLNDGFQRAFETSARWVQASTASVLNEEGAVVALATVVGKDGTLVTKASELPNGLVRIRPANREELIEASVVGADSETDLAVLKVDAQTTPVDWADDRARVGQFVVTVAPDRPVLAVGVVGVSERKIPGNSPLLGVGLGEPGPGVVGVPVMRVLPESGAAAAGLEVGDVIVNFMGRPVGSREALVDAIGRLQPDVPVELAFRRGDRVIEATTTLGRRDRFGSSRARFQNEMGGALSQRGGGFPLAFQHDTILRPSDVGGPVVDLDGRVLGVNISRSGRVETFTLPPSEVRRVVNKITREQHHAARE